MRIRVNAGRVSEYEKDLCDYLAPEGYHGYEQGELEDMKADIRELSQAVGRLLEKLVESRDLSLDQAIEVAGKWSGDSIDIIEGN